MILFRLFNKIASFQSYINNILVEKLNFFIIKYLYNIFIYTKDKTKGYIDVI